MKPHRLDPLSLLFGVLFTLTGLTYLGGSFRRPLWLLPVAVIAVGAAIIGSVARANDVDDRGPSPPLG